MKNVTVYTTNTCPYCTMVKGLLDEQNVPYNEVNVEERPDMMMKLIQTTGQMGVPQTQVNGQWIVGYDPARIMKALSN